jgi:dCTP deaminase
VSTYADQRIEEEAQKGRLITSNFSRANVHQACYELRMGNVYYDLSESDKPIQVPRGGRVLIKPFHRVVLITKEELNIPTNVIARITSKGSLFSVGLTPVSTYADPGFSGQIGIVTQNISDKYIELPIDESIAKAEFSELTGHVRHPYQGQHGFQTKIWPIKTQLQKTYDEVKSDPRVQDELTEAYKVTPRATGEMLKYLYRRQQWVLGAATLAIVSNVAVLLVSGNALDLALALLINLISAAIVAGLAIFQKGPFRS